MKTVYLYVDEAAAPLFRVGRADRFFERLRGLLGRRGLPSDTGLWIAPCGSVHTFFMRFPIDVVFVDRDGRIVRTVESLGAGRVAFARRSASVVELAAGGARRLGLAVGQRLTWSEDRRGSRLPLNAASQRRHVA